MHTYNSIFNQLLAVETNKEDNKAPHRGSGR